MNCNISVEYDRHIYMISNLVLFLATEHDKACSQSAKNVTRDLNSNDDLKNLRIKKSRKELIVSHDKDFIVIVIQEWTPAKEDQSHLQQPATRNKTKPKKKKLGNSAAGSVYSVCWAKLSISWQV